MTYVPLFSPATATTHLKGPHVDFAGLSPLILNIVPSFPVKVLRGPGQSIWVVDEGDYLSTTIDTASTNGKVYRVETQNLQTVNTLQ